MGRDPLTGLRPKAAFTAEGEARVRRATPFGVAVADVDGMKRYNAHNGHPAGDAVLQAIARLLPPDAFRIGGDTFALFDQDVAGAEAIRERVAAAVNPAQPAHCGDEHCLGAAPPPRLSIGVVAWRGESFAELLRRADDAVYRAKCNGRNRVETG